MIVSVLITGGLTVLAGSEPAKGQNQPETVTFSVNMDRQDALMQLAEGDQDMFLQSLSATVYNNMQQSIKDELDYWESSGGYNNWYFNRAREGNGTTAMQNALDEGWVDGNDPDNVQYCLNDANGNWEFNPFAVQDVRYAMNHFTNRQSFIQDLYDGFGEERYIWTARSSGAYQDRFKEFIEGGDPDPSDGDFGMSPSGNLEWAKNYIDDALTDIAENDKLAIGELRTPDQGDSGYWEYKAPNGNWKAVEITGAIRVEDARLDMGRTFADKLEEHANIKVENLEQSRSKLSPLVFSGTFDQGEWHFYTGGWLASGNVYYPHVALRQMYAPAYGFALPENSPGHWHYGQTEMGQKLNELTYDPFVGNVATADAYWDKIEKAVKAATRDSVRVYTMTSSAFYTYDKDTINTAVPNAITGWDQVFGPRTLDTAKDDINAQFYSSGGTLYMDNWNWYGGSEGAYGANQRRWVLGFSSWNDPTSGKPRPMLNDWRGNIETGFNFTEDGELIKELDVDWTNTDAVKYDLKDGSWDTVEDYYADRNGSAPDKVASKVTYDVKTGPWHHGEDYDIQDIMEWWARTKNIVYENPEDSKIPDYFYSKYSNENKPTWKKMEAIQFNPSEDQYTVWGTYTFPEKAMIGSYYALSPRNPQPVYEAISQEVYETDYAVHAPDETFGWNKGEGDYYVHLMGENQGEKYVKTMKNMQDQNWVPPYLDSSKDQAAPVTDMMTDATTYSNRLQSCIDFFNNHNNLFIANGPYMFADNKVELLEIELEKFDGYADYHEDGWEHWANTLPPAQHPVISAFNAESKRKGEVVFTAEAYIREEWPADSGFPIQEETFTKDVAILKKESTGEVVKKLAWSDLDTTAREENTLIQHRFRDLEAGTNYELTLQIAIEGIRKEASESTIVTVSGEETEPDISVTDFTVSPTEVEIDEQVNITGTIVNNGDGQGTIDLNMGDENKTYNLAAGESKDIEEETYFEESGIYTISLGSMSETVNVGSVETYTLTVNTDGQGSVTPSSDEFEKGSTVTVEATPADGWKFKEWTGDATGTEKSIDVTMDSDKTITAKFTEEYTLTINVEGEGSTDPSGTYTGSEGETVTVEATPADGYEFKEWTGDATGTEKSIDVTMDSDKTITAKFTETGDDGDGDGGTPGFTLGLFAIAAVVAVFVYQRKRR